MTKNKKKITTTASRHSNQMSSNEKKNLSFIILVATVGLLPALSVEKSFMI